MNQINYWVVGASWGGVDPQDEFFVENSMWGSSWSKDELGYNTAKNIKINDRIAIKRMGYEFEGVQGRGIRILHVGIVTGIFICDERVVCTVNWVYKNKNIIVHSRGCLASIHGPYKRGEKEEQTVWLDTIFSL